MKNKFKFGLLALTIVGSAVCEAAQISQFRRRSEQQNERLNSLEQFAANQIAEQGYQKTRVKSSIGEVKAQVYDPKPSIGRTVHFVLPDGKHRAAIITDDLAGRAIGRDPVALTVFLGLGDAKDENGAWYRSWQKMPVHHDPTGKTPGTWHWPERE